jgi:excisionase family DNA binding protein
MGIQHSAESSAVLTINETAIYFRISRASVWRLFRTGRLKKIRIGGRTLVRRVDADAFLASCAEAA